MWIPRPELSGRPPLNLDADFAEIAEIGMREGFPSEPREEGAAMPLERAGEA